MSIQPVLIGGRFRPSENPAGEFRAIDPKTKAALVERYPVSSQEDVNAAFEAAGGAVAALRARPIDKIADFLERYAARIEARTDALVQMAALETALPAEPRLRNVELPRTLTQLRQAAAAVRERSWSHATIDTKSKLRSHFAALGGPVVVFGPNNFPYAFNAIAGGDFVAAIAAGNPVIAKAHPGHPGTSRLLGECALEAVNEAGLPPALVQLLYHLPNELGLAMVGHPRVGATAFTGSRGAGLALKAAADRAGKPIYLELSSINPIFFLEGALAERGAALATELFESCALGAGQFCTRPGLSVLVESDAAQVFLESLKTAFEKASAGTLLGDSVLERLAANVALLTGDGAELLSGGHAIPGSRLAFEPTLLKVSASRFLENPEGLGRESFGALHLVVLAKNEAELLGVAEALEGNLTGGIYSASDGRDDALYAALAPIVRERVGRLLNDKMPTGVAVSPAMNHGGPYPATGHPGFTAVGIPASIVRFAALHSYDNVRDERLPPELRDRNPTGQMWRLLDGAWSQADVKAPG